MNKLKCFTGNCFYAAVWLVFLGFMTPVSVNAQADFQQTYASGLEALEAGDTQKYQEYMALTDSLRPNHPVVLYRLAAAYVMNDKPEKALEVLDYRADFFAAADFKEDSLFQALQTQSEYRQLVQKVDSLNREIQQSKPALSFDKKGFHAEGLVYSEKMKGFILSDVRCGELYFVGETGEDPKKIADLPELGFWGAMGMAVDPQNPEYLWVSSSVLPNYCNHSPELDGKSAILKMKIPEGSVEEVYRVEGDHVFGDLTTAQDGTVYFTDSMNPGVYRIPPGTKQAELFLEDDRFWNLQGLALAPGKMLISDYINGIFVYDFTSGQTDVFSANNQKLRGTDGLYYREGEVFLLQNGTRPIRVAKAKTGNNYRKQEGSYEILDAATPGLNEPTLGTFHNNRFYFISNSPWAYYDADNNPELEEWPVIELRYFDLNK